MINPPVIYTELLTGSDPSLPLYQEPRDPGRKKLKIQGVLAEGLLLFDSFCITARFLIRILMHQNYCLC
jgi:hypothetical protein